jgi:hypothetical protein
MADLPPYRTPRWVKIVGIIALVLILLLAIMVLSGIGGEHGPGRHLPSGNTAPALSHGVTAARPVDREHAPQQPC